MGLLYVCGAIVQTGEEGGMCVCTCAVLQAHLNTSFKHFIYFVHEFALIEKRELSPMQDLIDRMMKA